MENRREKGEDTGTCQWCCDSNNDCSWSYSTSGRRMATNKEECNSALVAGIWNSPPKCCASVAGNNIDCSWYNSTSGRRMATNKDECEEIGGTWNSPSPSPSQWDDRNKGGKLYHDPIVQYTSSSDCLNNCNQSLASSDYSTGRF